MKITGKQLAEVVGVLAVVASLLLVAFEIRQANRIAVVNTEFELRNSYQATNLALLTDPDMAEFLVRSNTPGVALEGADAVRARAWIFMQLNAWLAVALAYDNGVSTEATWRNILDNVEHAIGRASPEMRVFWRSALDSFPSLGESPVLQHADAVLQRLEGPPQ